MHLLSRNRSRPCRHRCHCHHLRHRRRRRHHAPLPGSHVPPGLPCMLRHVCVHTTHSCWPARGTIRVPLRRPSWPTEMRGAPQPEASMSGSSRRPDWAGASSTSAPRQGPSAGGALEPASGGFRDCRVERGRARERESVGAWERRSGGAAERRRRVRAWPRSLLFPRSSSKLAR